MKKTICALAFGLGLTLATGECVLTSEKNKQQVESIESKIITELAFYESLSASDKLVYLRNNLQGSTINYLVDDSNGLKYCFEKAELFYDFGDDQIRNLIITAMFDSINDHKLNPKQESECSHHRSEAFILRTNYDFLVKLINLTSKEKESKDFLKLNEELSKYKTKFKDNYIMFPGIVKKDSLIISFSMEDYGMAIVFDSLSNINNYSVYVAKRGLNVFEEIGDGGDFAKEHINHILSLAGKRQILTRNYDSWKIVKK